MRPTRPPVVSVRGIGRGLYRLTDRAGRHVVLRLDDFPGLHTWFLAEERTVRMHTWTKSMLKKFYPPKRIEALARKERIA